MRYHITSVSMKVKLDKSNFLIIAIEKRISLLLDKEDEEMVVEDSFDEFKLMYEPIIKKHFLDVMEIRDGKFYIDNDQRAVQKKLLMHVNDNVFKNLEGFSVRLFDED